MPEFKFSVRVDSARNVMYMAQEGHADVDDLRRLMVDYETALRRMQPGFVLVNDQRHLEPYSDEALEVAKELVELTNRHQASRVIRIVAEGLVSRTRVSRVLVSAQNRYENIRVNTPEEAEALIPIS